MWLDYFFSRGGLSLFGCSVSLVWTRPFQTVAVVGQLGCVVTPGISTLIRFLPSLEGVGTASAKMALSKTCNSASRIEYKVPCTSSEGQLCGIFRDIFQWNEVLWQCGLGLREHSPGELSLVTVREFDDDGTKRKVLRAVATRLHYLLTRHHCVTSIEMRVWMFWRFDELMYDALRDNLGLRKLKLIFCWSYFRRPPAHSFGAALLHLNHLRELACEGKHTDRSFAQGLSKFLASTRSLRTLNLSSFRIQHKNDAAAILHGLGRNTSIATLSINTSLLNPFPGELERLGLEWLQYPFMAADYLHSNTTLRTLSVSSRLPHFGLVRPMIETLLSNHFLTELSIIELSLENIEVKLINQLLIQNQTLTSFNLIECRLDEAAERRTGNSEGVTSRAHSLLLALTKNNTLQELTLTASWFDTNEYRYLVEVVASHASLKKVNFDVSKRKDAVEIYRAIRESGAQDRFYRGTHSILPENAHPLSPENAVAFLLENAVAFTEAKGPSGASVDSDVFYGYAQLLTAVNSQLSCSHVSSLWLLLTRDLLNVTVSSVIAQYLRGTTTLRDLMLGFNDAEVGDAVCEARRELLQALSVNKGVRRLGVYGSWYDEDDTCLLADTLLSSRTLCHVSFFPCDSDHVMPLVRRLSPNIFSNYTLLSINECSYDLRGSDWLRVSDVLRRNCALVTRASHFVRGAKHKYCVEAAELVQFNPGLVEKVQELASVDEKEAASRIKACLRDTTELNDFMRLAGVVKHGVTCHSRDDGKKQLVDIGRDCWLCIRQYLKLSDVLNEQ